MNRISGRCLRRAAVRAPVLPFRPARGLWEKEGKPASGSGALPDLEPELGGFHRRPCSGRGGGKVQGLGAGFRPQPTGKAGHVRQRRGSAVELFLFPQVDRPAFASGRTVRGCLFHRFHVTLAAGKGGRTALENGGSRSSGSVRRRTVDPELRKAGEGTREISFQAFDASGAMLWERGEKRRIRRVVVSDNQGGVGWLWKAAGSSFWAGGPGAVGEGRRNLTCRRRIFPSPTGSPWRWLRASATNRCTCTGAAGNCSGGGIWPLGGLGQR